MLRDSSAHYPEKAGLDYKNDCPGRDESAPGIYLWWFKMVRSLASPNLVSRRPVEIATGWYSLMGYAGLLPDSCGRHVPYLVVSIQLVRYC